MASVNKYADWKAPAEDGQSLIWPAPAELLAQTRENQRLLSNCQARIGNVPIADLRSAMRQWIGHDDARPMIGTGHQTELHHAGVWVKNAVIGAAADALGGEAYHIAVDTDEPKHLVLRWPPDGHMPLSDDPAASSAAWAGLVNSPTPAHLRDLEERLTVDAKSWPFTPVIGNFFSAMRRLALEPQSLPAALTASLHELDWSLGLRHHALLASPIWMSAGFLAFAHHLLANADQFGEIYNAALADYRRENGIASPGRPMPDLRVQADECEVPFWLDDLTNETRARPSIRRADGKWVMEIERDRFVFDASREATDAAHELTLFLRRHNLRLGPRALTLTMFLRLLVVDQFVHGIGGARYDQVTDRIIHSFFGIEPPRFAVATATIYFPTAIGRTRACLPCIAHEGHHLRHSLLGPRKRELVEQIATLPPRSHERRELFMRMHNEIDAAARTSPAISQWQQRYADAQQDDADDRVLFDRELFYALQPRNRLTTLIDRQRAAFAW